MNTDCCRSGRLGRFRNKHGRYPAFSHFLASAASHLLRRCGLPCRRPWLPLAAVAHVERFLSGRPNATCLEYGSGRSTLWLARRCRFLYSVEHDLDWFRRVSAGLQASGLARVVYQFQPQPAAYAAFPGREARFDFILVDGRHRVDCMRHALQRLAPGGLLYLDDTDRADNRPAEAALLEHAAQTGGCLQYVTDFVAGELVVREGLFYAPPPAWEIPVTFNGHYLSGAARPGAAAPIARRNKQ